MNNEVLKRFQRAGEIAYKIQSLEKELEQVMNGKSADTKEKKAAKARKNSVTGGVHINKQQIRTKILELVFRYPDSTVSFIHSFMRSNLSLPVSQVRIAQNMRRMVADKRLSFNEGTKTFRMVPVATTGFAQAAPGHHYSGNQLVAENKGAVTSQAGLPGNFGSHSAR